jgi:hypothetical protein
MTPGLATSFLISWRARDPFVLLPVHLLFPSADLHHVREVWNLSPRSQLHVRGRTVTLWVCLLQSRDRIPPSPPTVKGRTDTGTDVESRVERPRAAARGLSRMDAMSIGNRAWKQRRSAPGFLQRFTITVSADGASIAPRAVYRRHEPSPNPAHLGPLPLWLL